MTRKFLICDGGAVREASSDELLRGAAALIAQRFRRGAPVLENPDLTGSTCDTTSVRCLMKSSDCCCSIHDIG